MNEWTIKLEDCWVSVEVRLPKDNVQVLVSDSTDKIRLMDGQFVRLCTDATHWMYAPKSPTCHIKADGGG